MTRALLAFTVGAAGIRVRVRLLPTIADVDAEFRDGRRRRDGLITNAYFTPSRSARARHVGTIVVPRDGLLAELVPHEVTHAVMHHLGGVEAAADERLATTVGRLTARIHQRLESHL